MRFEWAIGIKNRLSSCGDFAWYIQMDVLKIGVKMDILLYLHRPTKETTMTEPFKEPAQTRVQFSNSIPRNKVRNFTESKSHSTVPQRPIYAYWLQARGQGAPGILPECPWTVESPTTAQPVALSPQIITRRQLPWISKIMIFDRPVFELAL